MKKVRNFSWWLLPVAWMGMIYLFSAQSVLPGPSLYTTDFLVKKLAHVCVYAGLYWCWWRAFQANGLIKHKYYWVAIWFLCVSYAIFDEWHQGQVPGRMMTWRDVGLDALASLLAAMWSERLL